MRIASSRKYRIITNNSRPSQGTAGWLHTKWPLTVELNTGDVVVLRILTADAEQPLKQITIQ